jgi:hypothetical protein
MKSTQNQLVAALKELETAMKSGEAELKKKPAEFERLKQLHAELKKVKPGQTPSAKLAALLQGFLASQLDAEIAEEKQRLGVSNGRTGPLALKDASAHREVLQALTQARQGVPSLDPTTPSHVVDAAALRLANANQSAARALADAEAAHAFAPPPARKSKK